MNKKSNVFIGADICSIPRIEKVYKKYKESFLNKVLTEREIKYIFKNKILAMPKLAGRFATKESVMKVLGKGIKKISFKEIEITNNSSGKPKVLLHKKAKQRAKELNIKSIDITSSHDGDYAIAFAIGTVL